jgi:putative transposase
MPAMIFESVLKKHNFVQSMSRKGDCWDNAVAESFFGIIKSELIHRERLRVPQDTLKGDIRVHRDLLQSETQTFYLGL